MNSTKFDNSLIFSLRLFVFIATLLFYLVGMKLKNIFTVKKSTQNSPSWISKCPDGWDIVNNYSCKNTRKIGKLCNVNDGNLIADFSNNIYSNDEGDYNKCKWAQRCNIPWQGIDNLCN